MSLLNIKRLNLQHRLAQQPLCPPFILTLQLSDTARPKELVDDGFSEVSSLSSEGEDGWLDIEEYVFSDQNVQYHPFLRGLQKAFGSLRISSIDVLEELQRLLPFTTQASSHADQMLAGINEMRSFMTKGLSGYLEDKFNDPLRLIERLVLLCYSALQMKSWSGIIAVFLLFLTESNGTALTFQTAKVLRELAAEDPFDETSSPESDEYDNQIGLRDQFDALLLDWNRFREHRGFKSFSKAISLAVAGGFLSAAKIPVALKDLGVFCDLAREKQFHALDFIDAILNTAHFFSTAGIDCIMSRSLAPLLFSDENEKKVVTEYEAIHGMMAYAKCGNWEMCGTNEDEFLFRLDSVIKEMENLKLMATIQSNKVLFGSYLRTVIDFRSEYLQSNVGGKLRVAPYGIKLYGKSSVGKSTMTARLIKSILAANNYENDDKYILSLNAADKYASGLQSSMTAIILDDFANTKYNFIQTAPTQLVIDLINNVPVAANMADLDRKGKTFFRPKVVVASSNVEDLSAITYSNEPFSILRRFKSHLTVRVKPEYSDSSGKIDDSRIPREMFSEQYPDLWDIDVKEAQSVNGKNISFVPRTMKVGPDNEIIMLAQSLETVVRALIYDSRHHFEIQNSVVNTTQVEIKTCECCNFPVSMCEKAMDYIEESYSEADVISETTKSSYGDKKKRFKNQLGEDDIISSSDSPTSPFNLLRHVKSLVDFTLWGGKYMRYLNISSFSFPWREANHVGLYQRTTDIATSMLYDSYTTFTKSPYCALAPWIPAWIWNSRVGGHLVDSYVNVMSERARKKQNVRIRNFWCSVAVTSLLAGLAIQYWGNQLTDNGGFGYYFGRCIQLVCPMYLGLAGVVASGVNFVLDRIAASEVEKRKIRRYLELQRREVYPLIFQSERGRFVRRAVGLAATAVGIYACMRIYRRFVTQSGVEAETVEDILERDAKANPWLERQKPSVPTSAKSKCMSQGFNTLVEKGIVFIRVGRFWFNAFVMTTDCLLIPRHYATTLDDGAECTIVRHPYHGGRSVVRFCRDAVFTIPNKDAAIWLVSGLGSYADSTDLFLSGKGSGKVLTRLTRRTEEGELVHYDQWGMFEKMASVQEGRMDAVSYQLDNGMSVTYKGLCGSVLYDVGRRVILGLHVAGITGEPHGFAVFVSQDEIRDAMQKHGKWLPLAEGDMQTEKYGHKYLDVQADIKASSPILHSMDNNASYTYLGGSGPQAKTNSNVLVSPISEAVAKIMGQPNLWGPPQLVPRYKPWQTAFTAYVAPAPGPLFTHLSWAIQDYLEPLKSVANMPPWSNEIRILSDSEVLNGIPGKHFIDGMKGGTSVGYPLGGPKNRFCDWSNGVRNLDPMFFEEANAACEKYLRGERSYEVFKATAKDEPTKIDKDKVRIFQAAGLSLQINVRRYFLSIARYLSLRPLTSECAVGVVAQGREWEQLCEHIERFGQDRIIAGDFSQYDLKLPAELTRAAFQVFFEIAEAAGYTQDDLKIMRGCMTDIIYPVVAYDGDMVMMHGSNPSGQNLTVYINSIANALLHRCAFRAIVGEGKSFRKYVALMTYGDDVKGSVSTKIHDFDFSTISDYMGSIGLKYTPPDKSDRTGITFFHSDDADFLKRKARRIEGIPVRVAQLAESSIFKSLHCYMKSDTPVAEIMGQNIDGALSEWFRYGREYYERRRLELEKVVKEIPLLTNAATRLHWTYDDWIADWHKCYGQA